VRSDPIAAGVIALAVAGGISLAVQNLLLSAMVARGLSHVTALALNSLIGVAFLLVVNVMLFGPGVADTVAQGWQWWFVLPGILGTIAVFAVLFGWTRVGATVPTVALIGTQIIAAALIDQLRIGPAARQLDPFGWLGIALVLIGATLVMVCRK
jgi:transporter family-2 protein